MRAVACLQSVSPGSAKHGVISPQRSWHQLLPRACSRSSALHLCDWPPWSLKPGLASSFAINCHTVLSALSWMIPVPTPAQLPSRGHPGAGPRGSTPRPPQPWLLLSWPLHPLHSVLPPEAISPRANTTVQKRELVHVGGLESQHLCVLPLGQASLSHISELLT